MFRRASKCTLFFFNDTATTEIYTLSLHDALPIFQVPPSCFPPSPPVILPSYVHARRMCSQFLDRKSTRLNSSHQIISYAVFCLKKKNRRGLLIYRLPPRGELHFATPL